MHVLVLEDDPAMAELAKIQLEPLGCEVTIVRSGEKARKLDLTNIDIAFIDWMLPQETGLEFAKWLKEYYPDIKRVIITAAPEALIYREGIIDDTVLKKIDWVTGGLVDLVNEYMDD